MSFQPSIQIQQLRYSVDQNLILNDLSLSFQACKTAIVGRNGVGKSTLLKLIVGELIPDSGSINSSETVSYCPQNVETYFAQTIGEVFGIEEEIKALSAIENGSTDERDFELLNDDWGVQERFSQKLNEFNLGYLTEDRLVQSLSGGEVTRLLLAKCFFEKADFIILDEPTNNLDRDSKQLLFSAIQNASNGFVIVSHDRDLLNLMDAIVELTPLGADVYSGNYDFFQKQKNIIQEARLHDFNDAKKTLEKLKRKIQITREKSDQREAYGKRIRKTGGQSKLILNSMQERSEQTKSSLKVQEDRRIKTAKTLLRESKKKMDFSRDINISLANIQLPQHKLVLKCEHVSFGFNHAELFIKNFCFSMIGPERIAIQGNNGCGKTTLVKLILNELSPLKGEIILKVARVQYFDQQVSMLNPAISVLENYLKFNPTISETQARFNLADFLFRGEDAKKLVCQLSGGEKLRAGLACALMSEVPPQLIILDEPTNHLDLDSIKNLESALNCFQGALIVISHDQSFIQNIGVTKIITAPFRE